MKLWYLISFNENNLVIQTFFHIFALWENYKK